MRSSIIADRSSNDMRRLISSLYAMVVSLRNRCYDRGIGVRSVGIPVVSVGNITVGGTGKTPMVLALTEWLCRRGLRVAVVSRGYGRQSRGTIVVADGSGTKVPVTSSGDELALIAQRIPTAVVIAAESRFEGALLAQEQYGADVVLLDDGFQHRRLHRDVDIVLVDAATLDPSNALIPCGTLREPLTNLHRADILCAIGVEREAVARYAADDVTVVEAYIRIRRWRTLDGVPTIPPVGDVVAVCAIANPQRFARSLRADAGVNVTDMLVWRDHHWYTRSDAERIIETARRLGTCSIVTTEKDAIKLAAFAEQFARAACVVRVAVAQLEFRSDDGEVLHLRLSNFLGR